MAVKHYINTRKECEILLKKMDVFFGYPNKKNTLTTSSIYELQEDGRCYMAIIENYILTEKEKTFLVSERPEELNK